MRRSRREKRKAPDSEDYVPRRERGLRRNTGKPQVFSEICDEDFLKSCRIRQVDWYYQTGRQYGKDRFGDEKDFAFLQRLHTREEEESEFVTNILYAWIGTYLYDWLNGLFSQSTNKKRAVIKKLQDIGFTDVKSARHAWQHENEEFSKQLWNFLKFMQDNYDVDRENTKEVFLKTMEQPLLIEGTKFAIHYHDPITTVFAIAIVITLDEAEDILQQLCNYFKVDTFRQLQECFLLRSRDVSDKLKEIVEFAHPEDEASKEKREKAIHDYGEFLDNLIVEADDEEEEEEEEEHETDEEEEEDDEEEESFEEQRDFYAETNTNATLIVDAITACLTNENVLPECPFDKIPKEKRGISERWSHMFHCIHRFIELISYRFKFLFFYHEECWDFSFQQVLVKILNDAFLLQHLDRYLIEKLGAFKCIFDATFFDMPEAECATDKIVAALHEFKGDLTKQEILSLAKGINMWIMYWKCLPTQVHIAAARLQAYYDARLKKEHWDLIGHALHPLKEKCLCLIKSNNAKLHNLQDKDKDPKALAQNHMLHGILTVIMTVEKGEFKPPKKTRVCEKLYLSEIFCAGYEK